MKIFARYWKLLIAVLLFAVATYAVSCTLQTNMAIQKTQAQEAKELPLATVETMTVKTSATQQALTLTGVLTAYQTLELLSETDGRITEIYFDLNQQVGSGQVLAKTGDKMKQTQSKIAELNYKKAKRDFERLEALFKNNNLSEYELENARFQMESAEQSLSLNQQVIDYTIIKSPISGNISQKFVSIGKVLQMGTPIAVITDISQFRLLVNIAPQDLDKIETGTAVTVNIPSQNIEGIKGIVRSISVQSNEAGSFPIEIIIQNNYSKPLRAGMQAEVIWENSSSRKTILIPRTAITGDQVFVLKDGKAIAKKITIAKEYGSEVEISAGLIEGEQLITKGQNNIENNQSVQVSTSNQ